MQKRTTEEKENNLHSFTKREEKVYSYAALLVSSDSVPPLCVRTLHAWETPFIGKKYSQQKPNTCWGFWKVLKCLLGQIH